MADDLYIYGKVGVDVMPVTTGFRRELETKLDAATNGMRFEIPANIDLDDAAYRAQKDRLESDSISQTVNLKYDDSDFRRQLRSMGGKDLEVEVPMDADTREFRREVNTEANRLEDTFSKALANGFDLGKSTAQRSIDDLRNDLARRNFQITPKVELDLGEAEREVDRLNRGLDIANAFDRQADQIERRADELASKFADMPVSLDTVRAVQQLRALEDRIKSGEQVSATVRGNVEFDVKSAEAQLDKLEHDHKQLQMDLDLDTSLATAHMAYFTRPRTVEIFADFKGTDMGKILNGMTSGATGLKDVENQFHNLVNLMDQLDSKVPKFALIGSVVASLAAGATNLAGSIGGVADSALRLSQIGYAAPAALGATAAGFYGLYAAVKTAGDNLDITDTKLGNLQGKVGDAFWDKAHDSIIRMSNALGDDFVNNLMQVSAEEGDVAAKLADIVSKANEGQRINAMLDYSADAVRNLSPGLQSVVSGLTSLGKTGGQYLPQFTNWLSGNMNLFSQWAQSVAADNDRVDQAMSDAKEQAGYLGSSMGSLKGILSGTFGTLATYENGIQGFSETLSQVDRAVNSIRFQETLSDWIAGAQNAQRTVRGSFSGIGDDAYSLRDTVKTTFQDAGTIVASTLRNGSSLIASSGDGFERFAGGVTSGWSKIMSAVSSASPAFSSILSMTGQLADTFGGTLASGLRASTPLIQLMATGATAVAKAFDALPDPIKGALSLWVTFGRAAKSGLDAVEKGMMDNITRTLQYRQTLAQVGITADQNKVKLSQMVQAMAVLKTGGNPFTSLTSALPSLDRTASSWHNVAMSYEEVGKAGGVASESTSKLSAANTVAAATALASESGSSRLGTAMSKAGSFASKAGSAILDAMGGPAGVAVSAGIGLMTAAMSDYNMKSTAMSDSSDRITKAIKNVSAEAPKGADALNSFGEAAKKSLSDANFGESGANWLFSKTLPFQNASSALKTLGMSMDSVSKSVSGTNGQYDQLMDRLNNTGKWIETYSGAQADDQKQAAQKVQMSVKALRDQMVDQLKTQADATGQGAAYVDKLLSEGEAVDQVAAKVESAAQKQQNAAQAKKMLTTESENTRNALISERAAGSQYEQTLAGMGDTISHVHDLVSQGQHVWDAQANDFDLTTEAGRTASDALGTLASNANDYVTSMVNAGAPLDEVNAKNESMRQEFYNTALQMTGNKQVAQELTDQYLQTPKEIQTEFKAKTDAAKLQLMQYLSLIRDTFPNGEGSAIYNTVVQAITSGAVTDLEGVQKLANKLESKKYTTVITANGEPARISIQDAIDLGLTYKNGKYSTSLSLSDLASPKLSAVIKTLKDAGATPGELRIILSGDTQAAAKIGNVQKLAKALGLTPAEISMVANTDNASKKLDDIKAKLRDKGLSNKQIQVLLDAIDRTKPPTDSAKKRVGEVPKAHNTSLDSTDRTGGPTTSAKNNIRSVPGGHGTAVDATDRTWGPTSTANSNIRRIPQSWGSNVWANVTGTGAVDALRRSISWLRDKTVTISTFFKSIHLATGGPVIGAVSGPGDGTSDSVPAMLSNGEYVLKASTVQTLESTYGSGVVDAINETGQLPSGIGLESLAELTALTGDLSNVITALEKSVNTPMQPREITSKPVINQTFTVNNHGVVNPYTAGTMYGRSVASASRLSLQGVA